MKALPKNTSQKGTPHATIQKKEENPYPGIQISSEQCATIFGNV